MKVFFLNPPWISQSQNGLLWGVRAGSRWPFTRHVRSAPNNPVFGDYSPYPFFLSYAATYAAKHTDFKVRLHDSIAYKEDYGAFLAYLERERPDFIVLEEWTSCWEHDQKLIKGIHDRWPNIQIIVCGPITIKKSKEILDTLPVVACVQGEYEKGVVRVLKGERGIIPFDILTTEEMNAAPFPYYDRWMAHLYCDENPAGHTYPHAHVWSSRGCYWKCLAGDTPVNTVEGMIPIKELVGRESIGVYTYDPIEKRAKVSTAHAIRKYGDSEKLVRVHFDDGTHIDCTPDHKFLAFKWGNQFTGEKEWISEAKDLKPGTHLRAIKTYLSGAVGDQYLRTSWTRKGGMKNHRMVMEWMLGRRLTESEHVHHKDHDKLNNLPSNLELCANAKEHWAKHPEISERMRTNNPAKNMTPEWREKLRKSITGLKRTPESKERYRLAAIKREAAKSKEQKLEDAKRLMAARGIAWEPHAEGNILNHRVVRVEELPGEHEVYCLTVPETGWFYANNVLVKNCQFCITPGSMTNNDPDGQGTRKMRFYSADYLTAFLADLKERFDFRSFYFDDDTMNMGNKHTNMVCDVMRKLQMPWSAMCRADTISKETWKNMRDSGCYGVKIGIETGSQYVMDKIVRKGLDLKEVEETAWYIRSLGMSLHGTFTYGHPGETAEQRKMTRAFRERLPLTSFQESGVAEMDGAPIAEMRERGALKGYEGVNFDENYTRDSDGVHKMTTEILKELRQ